MQHTELLTSWDGQVTLSPAPFPSFSLPLYPGLEGIDWKLRELCNELLHSQSARAIFKQKHRLCGKRVLLVWPGLRGNSKWEVRWREVRREGSTHCPFNANRTSGNSYAQVYKYSVVRATKTQRRFLSSLSTPVVLQNGVLFFQIFAGLYM